MWPLCHSPGNCSQLQSVPAGQWRNRCLKAEQAGNENDWHGHYLAVRFESFESSESFESFESHAKCWSTAGREHGLSCGIARSQNGPKDPKANTFGHSRNTQPMTCTWHVHDMCMKCRLPKELMAEWAFQRFLSEPWMLSWGNCRWPVHNIPQTWCSQVFTFYPWHHKSFAFSL